MRRLLVSILALACLLIGPTPADAVVVSAGTVATSGGELTALFVEGEGTEGNLPTFEYDPSDNTKVIVSDGIDTTPTAGTNCVLGPGGYKVECPVAPGGKVLQALVFNGFDGDDQLSNPDWPLPIVMSGGPGQDRLNATASVDVAFDGNDGNDTVNIVKGADATTHELFFDLGAGNDTAVVTSGKAVEVHGGPGNDDITTGDNPTSSGAFAPLTAVVQGDDGDDRIVLGEGKDEVHGGAGSDTVQYLALRRDPGGVTVTLDDAANDGRQGEGDNVDASGADAVENVEITLGFDFVSTVVGNDGPNALKGENADLDGRGGDDVLTGGDTTRQERIDGGAGNDTLVGGFGPDLLIGGEGVDSFSGDRTQSNVIATGDDRIEARDGNVEQIGCGVGADVVIADAGDVAASDCESVDRAAAPGGTTPGGTTPGGTNPGATGGATRPLAGTLTTRFRRVTGGWRITRLDISAIPAGATVEVRCRGRGCPLTRRTLRPSGGRASATASFRRKRLRAGVTVEVRITAPGKTGRVFRIVIRRRGAPKRSTLCLAPGVTKPSSCAS